MLATTVAEAGDRYGDRIAVRTSDGDELGYRDLARAADAAAAPPVADSAVGLRVPASPGGVAEPAVLSAPAISGNSNRKSNALGDPENCG